MPEISYDDLRREGIFAVLARLFPDEPSSRYLLEDLGVAPGSLRPFGQLAQELYWREAARSIDDGLLAGVGVGDLVEQALLRYPGNARLRALTERAAKGARETTAPATGELRVLCLAAGPKDETALELAAEHREIVMAVRRSPHPVLPVLHPAVRLDDVVQRMHDARPHMLHFGGHGGPDGVLVFEDGTGLAQPVDIAALARVLAELGTLQAVVLASCYSGAYAETLLAGAAHAVIGSPVPLADSCARAFARHFYRELGEGLDVSGAFNVAVGMMDAGDCRPHTLEIKVAP